jgi:anti-sigma factor RsiW
MTNAPEPHQTEALGAYALGALDERETAEVREHLARCAECRTELEAVNVMAETLGEIPPEAFLDGPPDGGDLLLQRTLRAVRAERSSSKRGRGVIGAAAAAVAVVVAIGGGVLIGEHGSASVASGGPPPTTAPPTSQPTFVPGTTTISGTSAGARLTATIIPAPGWIRVNASVTGIPAGEQCQLIVVSRSGQHVVAGGWLVSTKVAAKGVNLDGSALIAPDQIASIQVQNLTGHTFVTATT